MSFAMCVRVATCGDTSEEPSPPLPENEDEERENGFDRKSKNLHVTFLPNPEVIAIDNTATIKETAQMITFIESAIGCQPHSTRPPEKPPRTLPLFPYPKVRNAHVCDSDNYSPALSPPMASTKHMDEKERRTVLEFCHLLEESKQRFSILRDLPQFGHAQWHLFFDRTFEVYTKLWKFQQQHRSILDAKYGLKRWQIGEIASKIGQLYYHYYLRTSEIFYLNEAFAFYQAIRGRSYYTQATREDRCDLMVKKLRYYARFIVVCLLLRRMRLVNELVYELDRQIDDYAHTYGPDDQLAWINVVEEVRGFVLADSVVTVIDEHSHPVTLTYRLTADPTPSVCIPEELALRLEEIVIVSGSKVQAKYSEMSIDMYRMLQTFELDNVESRYPVYDGSPRPKDLPLLQRRGNVNPHKCMLYLPTISEVISHMACGCRSLTPEGAILLYISADASYPSGPATASTSADVNVGYNMTGLIMRREPADMSHDPRKTDHARETHCLHPADLNPFTRRPLFLIVESNNSHTFRQLKPHFGQPLVVFMSPEDIPDTFKGVSGRGSIFTQFLGAPLQAFCYVCDLNDIPTEFYKRAQTIVDKFFVELTKLFTHSNPAKSYMAFFGDLFVRPQILRFVFCDAVMRSHRSFRQKGCRPKCSPPLPEDVLDHPTLARIVQDLADYMDVRSQFVEAEWKGGGGAGVGGGSGGAGSATTSSRND